MKIAFDHSIFSYQSYGGISRYFERLSRNIFEFHDLKIFCGFYQNKYISEIPSEVVCGKFIGNFPPKSTRFFDFVNKNFSDISIKKWSPDIVHETYYCDNKRISKERRVTTAHDMIHELFPNNFSDRDNTTQLKKKTFNRVDSIICISENTKRDLLNFFDVDESKVKVIYHGVDFFESEKLTINFECKKKPFLLYVGNRAGYKNFNRFIEAVSISPRIKNDLNIIAFGGKNFEKKELDFFAKLNFKEGQIIHMIGDDAMLHALYREAAAFVYPSIYEGFGLPPLEAMAAGCPVVSSNTSSMPEVICDAGSYFDPYDLESMSYSIENTLFSESLRRDLINKGYENIKRFSWRKCADETLQVYKDLLS